MTSLTASIISKLSSFNETERDLLVSSADWITTDDLEPGFILYLSSLRLIFNEIEDDNIEDADSLQFFIKQALSTEELDQYIFKG